MKDKLISVITHYHKILEERNRNPRTLLNFIEALTLVGEKDSIPTSLQIKKIRKLVKQYGNHIPLRKVLRITKVVPFYRNITYTTLKGIRKTYFISLN